MKKYLRLIFLLGVFGMTMLLAQCSTDSLKNSTQEEPQTEYENIVSRIDSIVQAQGLMGTSLLLIANNHIAFEYYNGWEHRAEQRLVDSLTTFRIASISKTVVALGVLKLWEEGKVSLDEDVSTYLGWSLRNPYQPKAVITLRHLLGHTSGIRDGNGYPRFTRSMISEELDLRELFQPNGAYFSDDMFQNELPGSFFSYSNSAWGIIASIIESVSGMRLDEYTQVRLLQPIGSSASFNIEDIPRENIAALYRFEGGNWNPQADDYTQTPPFAPIYENYTPGKNGLLFGPQGSLRASGRDLALLGLELIAADRGESNLLSSGILSEMTDLPWIYNGKNGDSWDDFWISYGLGIQLITNRKGADIIFPDRRMIGHPGIAYGLISDLYVDPKTQSGIVFITNGSRKAYTYGEKTTFYEVEEALFEVLYPYLKLLEE